MKCVDFFFGHGGRFSERGKRVSWSRTASLAFQSIVGLHVRGTNSL